MEVDETLERVETVEEADRSKLATTAAILALTLLATISGGLAARADWRTSVAERERAIRGAAAQRAFQHLAQETAGLNDANVVRTETAVRALAASEAAQRGAVPRRYADALAAIAARAEMPDDAVREGFAEGVRTEQEGDEQAELVEEWTRRVVANLGISGLLAVALLLVGMSAAAHTKRARRAFLVTGCVLAAYGAARIAVVNGHDPRPAPAAAVEAYVDGVVALDGGDVDKAAAALARAVEVNPRYAAAWEALGDMYLSGTAKAGPQAATAYARAAALRSSPSPSLLNNLAYAEVLAGRGNDAVRHARAALALLPDDVAWARTTLTEAYVAAGDRDAALRAMDDVLRVFGKQPRAVRDDLASGWRRDQAQLRLANVGGALRDEVYAALDRGAATFEAFGTTAPRPRGPASVTALSQDYDRDTLRLRYTLAVAGGRPGDRVSVRVFSGTDLVASETVAANGRVTIDIPLDAGRYRVEVWLNGSFVGANDASF